MSLTQTNTIAKIAAVVAGLGLVAMTFVAAAPAKAADTMFNTNLTIGSKGADVSALQTWLIGKGFSIPAGATGYFGGQTKAALAAYQSANHISPAVGYFGPLTRASVNAGGAMSTGGTGTTGTGTLTGAGRLTNVGYNGNVTSDIKAGDPSTNVIGITADATGGDVAIQRVDATFVVSSATINGGVQSGNLNKYVSSVDLYLDGVKLGSMDPATGDKVGSTWTLRFSGLNGVIKAGHTGNLYVKVTPLTSIGTHEDGGTVTAELLTGAVRAAGGDGLSDTYVTRTPVTNDQAFTVKSMTSGTLTLSAGSDNPNSSQIAVASSTTTGVKVLSFNMKAKNQPVSVDAVDVSFGTSDNNLSDVVTTAYLMQGSTVLSSKTLSSGAYQVVTFNNLNQTIAKDATTNYTVVLDIKGDSAYTDGTTLVASTTNGGGGWDSTDANGSTITPSAAVVGNTMTFTATGMSVVAGTPTATVASASFSGGVDTATLAIPFTVTAGDSDIFVSGVATQGTGAGAGIRYGTTTTSTQGATTQPTATFTAAGATVTGDLIGSYYKVLANTSRTFTLTAAYTASSSGVTAGFVGAQLNSIAYGTTNALGSSYTSNLTAFVTPNVYVQKH